MAVAACPAEVTLQTAPAAFEAARAALRAAPGVLDLSGLVRFDSAAVALLVALRREAGPRIAFRNPPPNVRKLASLYGVEALLFG
ncbi:MAG TPA: STAS domain-containing protein [Burkholderiaceae bacterium]|nr:STAS domain-containing protein [Burkholderiaceae bacterium]